MATKLTARQLYDQMQAALDLHPGDKVKILRIAKSHELGWGVQWNSEMNANVGKIMTVTRVESGNGILLNSQFWYPWFVLEIVSKSNAVKLNDKYTAILSHAGIQVGCQTFPLDIAQKLVDAVKLLGPKPVVKKKPRRKVLGY